MISTYSSPPLDLDALSLPTWKARLLYWASQYPYVTFLDNCQSDIDRYGRFECLLGVARADAQTLTTWDALRQSTDRWKLGALPYDLKNVMEPKLHTQYEAEVVFPEVAFFIPDLIIGVERDSLEVKVLHQSREEEIVWAQMEAQGEAMQQQAQSLIQPSLSFESLTDRSQYLNQIRQLQQHIVEGDCYEVNLTQAFVAEGQLVDPVGSFLNLKALSPVPFAAFVKWKGRYILSASPERFLQLKDDRLLSQPIKGTAPRSKNPKEDQAHKAYLKSSIKEQAENVMIVDLTRNDLHRSCETGSVHVPHLFEIQHFPQVFQMVSTVVGQKKAIVSTFEALEHTFPPGSMTGAPKFRTMEIIDQIEPTARGVYAGSIGYFDPKGDFDLNVVIRSLVYDANQGQLAYHVGGAITYDSDPEAEYEETLVKARALKAVFG